MAAEDRRDYDRADEIWESVRAQLIAVDEDLKRYGLEEPPRENRRGYR
jgi:hypothetical protein